MTSVLPPRARPRTLRRRSRIEACAAGQPVPRESWDLGLALTVSGAETAEPIRIDDGAPRRRPIDQ